MGQEEEEDGDAEQVEFEGRDVVDDLQSNVAVSLPDDQLTSVSKASSRSKVLSLAKQLQEEKEARKKLEGELQ